MAGSRLLEQSNLVLDEVAQGGDTRSTVEFDPRALRREDIVNGLAKRGIGDRSVHELAELDRNGSKPLVDPTHREQRTEHIEILLPPHDVALQVLSNVSVGHVKIMKEARPWRVESRQQGT